MRAIASVLKHLFSEVTQDVSRAPRVPLHFALDVVLPVPVIGRNAKDPALQENALNDLLQLLFVFSERRKIRRVLRQDYSLALRQDRLFVLSQEILKLLPIGSNSKEGLTRFNALTILRIIYFH
jgi:hypothetical protein